MIEVISVHIPKTAGTAFRHVLLDVYGMESVLEDYPPDRIHQLNQPISDKIQVIHGHFAPNKYKQYFSQAKKIVWLRHPIFRLISEYFFAKTIQDRANAIHFQLLEQNLGIVEFAAIPAMRNFLSRKIEGMKLAEFDFVGIQEFYPSDLAELQKLLSWKDFQATTKNSNRYPEYYKCLQEVLSDRTMINSLAQLNQQDMELYTEALEIRAKRRNESVQIQSTLADWQRSQYLLQQMQAELARDRLELRQIRYWLKQSYQKAQTLEFKLVDQIQVAHLLTGFYVDSPQAKIATDTNLIVVSGWAIGKNVPASQVIITNNGQILCQTDVNLPRPDVAQVYPMIEAKNSGFETYLVVNGIPAQAKLKLQLVLKDGTKVAIGTISS
jgi:hypothetical protein